MQELSEDRTFRNFLVVTGVAFGALVLGGQFAGGPERQALTGEVGSVAETAESNPAGEDQQARAEPTITAPDNQATMPRSIGGRTSVVHLYDCVVDGQRVFTDQPCVGEGQARTLVVAQPEPREAALQQQRLWREQQQVARTIASSRLRYQGSSPAVESLPSNQASCQSIDQAIERLNTRMRQRYSSWEGEQLRAQWHALKERRHELRCGR